MPKLLVVDGDKNMRMVSRSVLADAGYEVRTAANAREALRRFRSNRPDLVVLDIRMPAITDGIEVLSRMMSLDSKVPVILFSAHSIYLDSFLSWCADAFIPKSSDLSELKDAIRYQLLRRPPLPSAQPGVSVMAAL